MPTKHQRILVTRDGELDDALTRVAPLVGPVPTARLVHDLAVRGAEAVLADRERSGAGLAELVRVFRERDESVIDFGVLARTDQEAWGIEPDPELR